jgi:hypothetical protein
MGWGRSPLGAAPRARHRRPGFSAPARLAPPLDGPAHFPNCFPGRSPASTAMAKVYSLEDCKKHVSDKDCWLVVHGAAAQGVGDAIWMAFPPLRGALRRPPASPAPQQTAPVSLRPRRQGVRRDGLPGGAPRRIRRHPDLFGCGGAGRGAPGRLPSRARAGAEGHASRPRAQARTPPRTSRRSATATARGKCSTSTTSATTRWVGARARPRATRRARRCCRSCAALRTPAACGRRAAGASGPRGALRRRRGPAAASGRGAAAAGGRAGQRPAARPQ